MRELQSSDPGARNVLRPPPAGALRIRPGHLTRRESRAIGRLCAFHAIGILGLYAVLPVLSPYAHRLPGQTGFLVGFAIGAYGLTQAICQVPLGHLGDRLGRKRAIFLGLLSFAIGSLVAASAKQISVLILGRLLQGAGAVTSVVVSLIADLARPGVRTQAMARLSFAVTVTVACGMICGPVLAHFAGVPFIFGLAAALALAAAFCVLFLIPAPRHRRAEESLHAGSLLPILRMKPMIILDVGTFLVHTVVTVLFVVVPFDLHQGRAIGNTPLAWKVGLPVALAGVAAMFLAARHSDRAGRARFVLYAGTALLLASCLIFAFFGQSEGAAPRPAGMALGILAFVLAAAVLEPGLPSRVSHLAVGRHRGAAMGVFHMGQFLGTFAGGLLGGAFLTSDRTPLFLGLALASGLWMLALPGITEHPGIPPSSAVNLNLAGKS